MSVPLLRLQNTQARARVLLGLPAVLAADDVIDMATKEGVLLADQAVLAAVGSSFPDGPPELDTDRVDAHARYREGAARRARALARRIMCSSCK